jgi:hypothetical protein
MRKARCWLSYFIIEHLRLFIFLYPQVFYTPTMVKVLYLLRFSGILSDGDLTFCNSHRVSVDPLSLSVHVTLAPSKEVITEGGNHHGTLHDSSGLHL